MAESSIHISLNALFFEFVVGCVLFGAVLLESYRYFKTYQNDSSRQKFLVRFLFCLDAMHFAFSIHMAYHYLILNVGNPDTLATLRAVCLYLTRIYSLTRKTLLDRNLAVPILCAVVVIALIALGTNGIESILDFSEIKWVVYLAFGVSAAVDIAIAAIMMILLHRSITGIKRTDGVLCALTHYFFSTGLLTSLAALIYIVLYSVQSTTSLYLGMVFLISRLYAISFLELLHIRKQLREELDATIPFSLNSSSFEIKFNTKQTASNSLNASNSSASDTIPPSENFVSFIRHCVWQSIS
ncbi:hypothetical protein GYMLUDRAFT_73718 [Collybiopsis luxurians FD-317 M1]|uniref:DUF6534 domain-containing protein n=1 Tax=Collybiopsis luxurians FD-317 M1 TaxID=944289 RepID=A0A0D0BB39_9AGAR|nr:hypothetical protein GYMLUDRAFT_73718 [Collybiopsis luxurians FD-317 M1]